MTTGEILTALGVFISLAISVGSAWVQWRKFGAVELPKAGVDIASIQVDTSLDLVKELRAEVDKLRVDVAFLRSENETLKKALSELEDVRQWAERLAHQVQSLGGTPVKMRITK